MSGSLARYHARSPRYVLDTQDNSLIRYSGAERLPWEEKTELRNVSLTGLSFVCANDLSPQLGEIIKIQFAVPGSESMACYAIVIRIAPEDNYSNEVAVHFYKLDRLQRINLVQGLAVKMDTKKFNLGGDNDRKKVGDHFFYLTLMFFSILSWLVLMNLYL
ncbi:PilZ domain-containing protein [Pseudobdellovibrio sp. HCB154]|uniref:PilZ domain-containing protein n=1 Tax=Pseudobdellovibrio sp. HCB154 TaxID=3386277 RepID=UPI00391715DB